MGVTCEYSDLFEYGFRTHCLSVAVRGAHVVILDAGVTVLRLLYFPFLTILLSLDHFIFSPQSRIALTHAPLLFLLHFVSDDVSTVYLLRSLLAFARV